MDSAYAEGRKRKPHLIFRYRVRATVVAQAAGRYLENASHMRVLDFGSADGLTLLELDRLLPNSRFLGIEYSNELLSCVPELPDNIEIRQGDITALPADVEDAGYDLISALAVLEHLPDPLGAMAAAVKKLRPGGIFVATCPNPFWDDLSTRLGLLRGECHESHIGRAEMTTLAEKSGLEVVTFEPFMWAPVGFLPYIAVPVSPRFALSIDRSVRSLRILNWGFVNQCLIARRPKG
ncbi:MAG: methyltransferase domain-containing protein [Kiritimatiellia bacterium]|nr:methyltransferase domain-containing protein [Kiritimatiellia bacterium]MDP7022767.1 methyltransferase domain-containing protein [Kiritimatiellia bacterium]